jgi:hypothetical protein
MKNKIILIGLLITVVSLYSCSKLYDMNQPDVPAVGNSSTYPLSGEWWVQYFDDPELTIVDAYGDWQPLLTYNTAANDGKEMWITDRGNFWVYTVKCPVNLSGKSFAGDSLVSTGTYTSGGVLNLYDIKVNVTNGKVIPGGGLSTSGVVCDSIYFEVEFEDNLGTVYYVYGVRRTGFLEDEH